MIEYDCRARFQALDGCMCAAWELEEWLVCLLLSECGVCVPNSVLVAFNIRLQVRRLYVCAFCRVRCGSHVFSAGCT